MKILKYIIFFLLAILLLFFLVGLLKPSVSYGHEILTDKSIEESWAVSQDVSTYDQWLEGFKSMELISGNKYEVGSRYKVIVNPGEGQPDFEMIETLKAIKENEYVDMHFESDMMDFEQVISFAKKDGKTSVKTDSKVIGKGIVMKSMFALMEMLGGSFQAQETKNIEALKKLIDGNQKNYFPVEETAVMEKG
jgi:hypothetical protein